MSSANESFGTFSLTLANSTIDFGSGSGDWLIFGAVGTHGSGIKLALLNWSGTANQVGSAANDRLIFTGSISAFTGAYLQADVSFNGVNGYLLIDIGGGQFEIVAVPEPASALLLGGAAMGLMGFRRRPQPAK